MLPVKSSVSARNDIATLVIILIQISSSEVGSDSCVGLLGASIGGGIGPYGGLHGLQLDALQSAHIVTGTGEILDISAQSHPDLFWGVRGAGHNFGIITSAKYRVYDFTNNGQAMNADFRIKGSYAAQVFQYLKNFQGRQPDNLSFEMGIAYDPTFGGVSALLFVDQKSANNTHRLIFCSMLCTLDRWQRVRSWFNHWLTLTLFKPALQ